MFEFKIMLTDKDYDAFVKYRQSKGMTNQKLIESIGQRVKFRFLFYVSYRLLFSQPHYKILLEL